MLSTTRRDVRLTTAALCGLAFLTLAPAELPAQSSRSTARARMAEPAESLAVSPDFKFRIHADTVMFIRQLAPGPDTIVNLVHGDTVWRLRPGPKEQLGAAQAAMLLKLIELNRRSIRVERMLPPPA